MTTNTTYNGWTNYATWRVNLEIFDGVPANDFDGTDDSEVDLHYVAEQLKDYAEELIMVTSEHGLARDYALAFLSDVNWYEIAQHMVDDYILENQQGD